MTRPYELLKDAETDLREVASYTLKKWGKESLAIYRRGINKALIDIAKGEVIRNTFSNTYPHVLVTKYKYYYPLHVEVYITANREKPLIIGVIHERRDVVNMLGERLT